MTKRPDNLTKAELMAAVESSRTALTAGQAAKMIHRSTSHVALLMNELTEEGKLVCVECLDKRSHYVKMFYPLGLPAVMPEGYTMKGQARRLAGRPIKGEIPKRVMVAAKQVGMMRHWLDVALFGDGPAHGEVVA